MPWAYDLRCLECSSEYSASTRDVFVGPLHEEVITGSDHAHGIDFLLTKPLYTGAITDISCPSCLLRLSIASDLAPTSLRRYLDYQVDQFEGLKMDRVFDTSSARALIRPFPFECPRCAAMISGPAQRKACKACGSTQLQTIRSSSDGASDAPPLDG